MTTMMLQAAQAADRMHRSQQAAELHRTRRAKSAQEDRAKSAPERRAGSRNGSLRSDQTSHRLMNGAAASSAFATGRG